MLLTTILQGQPVYLPSSVINTAIGSFGVLFTTMVVAIVKLFTGYIKHKNEFSLYKKEKAKDITEIKTSITDNEGDYQEDKKELKGVIDEFKTDLHKHALDSQKMNGEVKREILELKADVREQVASINGKLEILLNKKK